MIAGYPAGAEALTLGHLKLGGATGFPHLRRADGGEVSIARAKQARSARWVL